MLGICFLELLTTEPMNDQAASTPMGQINSPDYTSLEATSGDQLVELLRKRIAEHRQHLEGLEQLSHDERTAASESYRPVAIDDCSRAREAILVQRQAGEQGRTANDLTIEQRLYQGFLPDLHSILRKDLIRVGELLDLEPCDYYIPAIGPSLRRDLFIKSRLSDEHHQHLEVELGPHGACRAAINGARSVDANVASQFGFRFKGWDGGGLLLPFGCDFAQLRCDQPPSASNGDPVKYLNRKGSNQWPATFGGGEPTIATEGWKDALRLHLETGETVQALPGVTSWRLLAPRVNLLIYDADAAENPAVWSQLIRAGLERPSLRLAFFPRDLAGDKGGACEFFNAGGDLGAVKRWKARELLRELPKRWDRSLRVDWHAPAVRRLAVLARKAGFDQVATEQLACAAGKAIGLRLPLVRDLMARVVEAPQPVSGETPRCPEDPTKQQLQEFLRQAHQIRFNTLSQLVEIDGHPAEDIDLADSLLAHIHGIETTKQAARDSLIYVAKSNLRNPIADYLEGLSEIPGLRLLNIEEVAGAFGIPPKDKLSQELLARHLAGAYRRGMKPGHKHDQMLILCGYQGQGKGEAIKALFSPALYGSATRVAKGLEDREFLTTLNSIWGFEFDECEKALLGRDASEFKGFTTRDRDRYVQKYETVSREHPRRSVLFGTSNETEILNDSTGSRRYWLIDVRGETLDPAWIRENRDSIWATVSTWVDWGLENWLPQHSEAAALAAERASGARLSDPWEGPIATYLDGLLPEGDGIAQEVLISQALQVDQPIKVDRNVQMRVARIVTASDFRTHRGKVRWTQKKRRYGGGSPRSGYVPEPVPIVQTRSELIRSNWNGHKPWEDRSLTSLFQPFQPFKEEYQESFSACIHAEKVTVGACMSPVVGGFEAVGRNGWNGAEIPLPDCDELFQSGMEQSLETRTHRTEHPVAAPPPQSPLLSTVSNLPAAAPPVAPSAAVEPAAPPSQSDSTLTCREQVEQALADLKAGPESPGILILLRARLPGIPSARIETVLQELIHEEREAEQPDLLG